MSCIITFNGQEYTQNDFMALLYEGQLQDFVSKEAISKELLKKMPQEDKVETVTTTESRSIQSLSKAERQKALPKLEYASQQRAGVNQVVTTALGSEVIFSQNPNGTWKIESMDQIAGEDFDADKLANLDDAKNALTEFLETPVIFNKLYEDSVNTNTNSDFVNNVNTILNEAQPTAQAKDTTGTTVTGQAPVSPEVAEETPELSSEAEVTELKEAAGKRQEVNLVAPQVVEEVAKTETVREAKPIPFKVGDRVKYQNSNYIVEEIILPKTSEKVIFNEVGKMVKTNQTSEAKIKISNKDAFGKIRYEYVSPSVLSKPLERTISTKGTELETQIQAERVNKVAAREGERNYKNNPPEQGEKVLYKGLPYIVNYLLNKDGDIRPDTLKLTKVVKKKDGSVAMADLKYNGKIVRPALEDLKEPQDIYDKRMSGEETDFEADARAKKRLALINIAKAMQNIFVYGPDKNIEFEVVYSDENWKGVFRNGKVLINERLADLNTPIHEFLHPFVAVLKIENRPLYDSLVASMVNYPEYAKILKDVESVPEYANGSQEDIDEEIIVRLLAPRVGKIFNQDGTINQDKVEEVREKNKGILMQVVEKIKAYIIKFLGEIGLTFGQKIKTAGLYIEDINNIEYDLDRNTLLVYTPDQETPKIRVTNIGTEDSFNLEKALNVLSPWVNYEEVGITVELKNSNADGAVFDVFKDGKKVAENIVLRTKAVVEEEVVDETMTTVSEEETTTKKKRKTKKTKEEGEEEEKPKNTNPVYYSENLKLPSSLMNSKTLPAIYQAFADTLRDAGVKKFRIVSSKDSTIKSKAAQPVAEQAMWANRNNFEGRSYLSDFGRENPETFKKILTTLQEQVAIEKKLRDKKTTLLAAALEDEAQNREARIAEADTYYAEARAFLESKDGPRDINAIRKKIEGLKKLLAGLKEEISEAPNRAEFVRLKKEIKKTENSIESKQAYVEEYFALLKEASKNAAYTGYEWNEIENEVSNEDAKRTSYTTTWGWIRNFKNPVLQAQFLQPKSSISFSVTDPIVQETFGGTNIFGVSKKYTSGGLNSFVDSSFFKTYFVKNESKIKAKNETLEKTQEQFDKFLEFAIEGAPQSANRLEFLTFLNEKVKTIKGQTTDFRRIYSRMLKEKTVVVDEDVNGNPIKEEMTVGDTLELIDSLNPQNNKLASESKESGEVVTDFLVKEPNPTNKFLDGTMALNKSLTLDELAAIISFGGSYKFSLGQHQELFEKMSDKYDIDSLDKLKKFTNTLRNNLVNFQDLLERRAASTELTPEMKSRVTKVMSTIKPIYEGLVTEDKYAEHATALVRDGMQALGAAEQMMKKIRTKLNYGSSDEYLNTLINRLLMEGITIDMKPKNFNAITIVGETVQINRDRFNKEGVIPEDITKFISSRAKPSEDFRKKLQKVNKQTIKSLRKELRPEEIQELNWEIIAMRNYYATFKGFTRRLLREYIDELEEAEVTEFSRILSDSGSRMAELEIDMTKLASDWLFPYFDNLQKTALQGLSPEEYDANYKDKEQFTKLLRYANEDNNAFDHLFGALVNSKDPVNATVALIVQERINRNEAVLGQIVAEVFDSREKFFKPIGVNTTAQRAEHIKTNYLRKARIKVEQRDSNGNLVKIGNKVQYEYKEKWAIHQEFLEDKFQEDLDTYISSLAEIPRPTTSNTIHWDIYNKKVAEQKFLIEKWKITNRPNYKNPEYARLIANDAMFRFLSSSYESANSRYGEARLKFGIVPQSYIPDAFIKKQKKKVEDIKAWQARVKAGKTSKTEKFLGSVKAASNYVLSTEDKIYYEQTNPDDTVYRSVKTKYLRLIDEDVVNLDLTDTIAGFTEDALRYESLRSIQGNIENLRLLINGYAGAGIKARTAPETDKDGNLIWQALSRKTKKKADSEMRLNIQLNQFIDDVFYGDKQKERSLRLYSSPEYKKNYKKALEMMKEGKTPDEIMDATTFYRDESGRWKTDIYQNVSVNLNKIANGMSFYTSANSLAFNVMSTTRNLSIGNFQNLSEAFGGLYYKPRHYAEASKIYWANLPSSSVDFVAGKRASKLSQVLFDFQAIQGEFRDRYNQITTDPGVIARLFRADSLFFLQRVAEHQIQGTATVALMLATKVKTKSGEEISLWDAYEINNKGLLALRDDVDLSTVNQDAFIRKLHEMNRANHGNYSDLHKTVIQREWYGSLFMAFRKHLYPTLFARFGKKQIDYSKGRVTQGFHRTFFKKIIQDIQTHGWDIMNYESIMRDKSGVWTESEIYEFRRAAIESLFLLASMLVLSIVLAGDEDDDDETDSVIKKWAISLLSGLYTDVAITNPLGFYNPFTNHSEVWNDIKRMTANPVAVQFTYKKLIDFFSALLDEDADAEDVKRKALKIIPVIRHTEAITNPDDYVENYLKFQRMTGRVWTTDDDE